MAVINIIQLLTLSTLLFSAPSLAFYSHSQNYETDLDTVLCQSVHTLKQVIVDIRSSMDRGADLIDGKWVRDEDACISTCCGIKNCDIALFKTEGTSSSGKNCYFINCGDSPSNCVMVDHDGFSSVQVGGRRQGVPDTDTGYDRESNHIVPVQPSSSPLTTTPPPPLTTHLTEPKDTPTSPPKVENNPPTPSTDSKSNSHSTTSDSNSKLPTPVPSSSEAQPETVKPGAAQNDVKDAVAGGGDQVPVESPNNGGSGLIAVAIIGVICFVVVVIVVGVLVRKVFNDQRRKRFRNVDYLINGMYT